MKHLHPVNVAHHDQASFGARIADRMSAGIGSWTFLIVQTIAVALWVALNITGFVQHWDVFPFILLNLMFSVQAAYTGPILLLAGNRQAQKDRLTLEHTAAESDKSDRQNEEILREIKANTEATLRIERRVEQSMQPPPPAPAPPARQPRARRPAA